LDQRPPAWRPIQSLVPQGHRPTTVEGIEKYLGSGMIRGIGPVFAKRLVRAFGVAAFAIIEQQPDRRRKEPGSAPSGRG
jgi:hypothetical protein